MAYRVLKIVAIILLVIVSPVVLVAAIFMTSRDRAVLLSRSQEFQHQGRTRNFRVSLPPANKAPTKLIVGLHGFGGNSRQFAYYTALHNSAPGGTVVIYPDALKPESGDLSTGWNSGFCCGSGWKAGIDDVGFLEALIKDQLAQHGISDDQVYVTGFSNGAFMAMRLAAEKPDLVRAVAVSSGTIGVQDNQIELTEPVPILLMHGDQDKRVSFDGGASAGDPDFVWQSFEQTREAWANNNGCSDDPQVIDNAQTITYSFLECSANTKAIVYKGNGHKWAGWRLANFWNKQTEASQQVMNFFAEN